MKKNTPMISRRDFLRGAAAGAVSLAGMGILGGCAGGTDTSAAAQGTTAESTTEAPSSAAAETSASSVKGDETAEAAASSAAVSQAGWRTAPDPVDDSQIKETHDADVVVVGHGYAGLNACRYLAAQGVKVILIESQA